MKKIIFLIIAGYLPFVLSAQRGNIWYFGDHAGLDFSSGTPVLLTNGVLNTLEGCASICDLNGNLLFYTDGITVYSKTHTVMSNGSGLQGGYSSSQSAIIIPVPGSNLLYYIFTIGEVQSPLGLSYSQVDMSLNGGNGGVINKNTPLYSFPATEKLTAVYHANGTDVWVAIHVINSNAFYAYLVSSSGISAPVISNSGMVHTGQNGEMGYMKFSPDGNKLAAAITILDTVEIFDFDKSTGVISNPITYIPSLGDFPYGIEFSPDASKLYVMMDNTPGRIFQLDMNAGSPSAILASEQLVHAAVDNGGALQTGPDGKIYFTRHQSSWIGVINNPNASGTACNPVSNGVMLGSGQCQLGLPDFLTDYFYVTGIDEPAMDLMFSIFPNPFSGRLNITIRNNDVTEIFLFDITGRKLFQEEFINSITLNTVQLSKGIYIYEVRNKSAVIKKGKVVKD